MTTTIEHKAIASVVKSKRLSVPVHQRSFEWTKVEVGELLGDIGESFSRQREEYFLGSIVVITPKKGGDRHEVLDGQQRLASVCLLLASIADEFLAREEVEAEQAVRQMVASYDLDQGAFATHLKLNAQDDPYFNALLRPEFPGPAVGSPDSHGLLFAARVQTKTWLAERLANESGAKAWLKDVTKYLGQSVRVIYFGVADDANAYLIFETLNDRGLDLSIADLLKNFLLGRANEDLEAVLNLWTRTLMNLKAYGGEGSFTTFLRHYWSSKYEVVREKDLYRRVKARITSSANVLDFAAELAASSYHYTALLSAEHEYWSQATPETRGRLAALSVLGLEQYRPMLLAALAHFEMKDVEALLRMLESWNVRLVIVGGLGGGTMENNYASLGRAIRAGEVKGIKDLAAKATDFVPGDAEFRSQFAVATVSKVPLARYYLNALERQGRKTKDLEVVPSPSLTLEHVLPERPGSNWQQFSDEEKRLYTRRLGNLCLLTEKSNSEAKSAPFTEKRPMYKAAELKLTKEIGQYSAWNVANIDKRQEALAELALKVWPLNAK